MDSWEKGIPFQTTPKPQYNANTKFVSIWTQPSHCIGVHWTELCCHSSGHTQFATLLWRWNNLLLTVLADDSGLQCLWPDNALGFGTHLRTAVALLSSLALKNSSQTSYHKSFCSKSWRPCGSTISSNHAMARQSVSSSAPLTPNKIQLWKYLLLRCNFTQAALEVSTVFFSFPTAVSTVLHYYQSRAFHKLFVSDTKKQCNSPSHLFKKNSALFFTQTK